MKYATYVPPLAGDKFNKNYLESLIQSKVSSYARTQGWLAYKFESPTTRSLPDFIYLRDGLTFFIEFKSWGKKATEQQKERHNDLILQGFQVFIVDCVPAGKRLIDEMGMFF